jgi:hypothetical protein
MAFKENIMKVRKIKNSKVKEVINRVFNLYIAKASLYSNQTDDIIAKERTRLDAQHLVIIRDDLLKCKTYKEYDEYYFVCDEDSIKNKKIAFPQFYLESKVNTDDLLTDSFDDIYLYEYSLEEFAGDLHKLIKRISYTMTADICVTDGKLHLLEEYDFEEIV